MENKMVKHIHLPKWIFEDFVCDRCEIEFNSPNFEGDTIAAVKNDDSPTKYYCGSCYEIIKNSKFESAIIEFKEWINKLNTDSYSDFTIQWVDNWRYRLDETKAIKYVIIEMSVDTKSVLNIMSTITYDYILFE